MAGTVGECPDTLRGFCQASTLLAVDRWAGNVLAQGRAKQETINETYVRNGIDGADGAGGGRGPDSSTGPGAPAGADCGRSRSADRDCRTGLHIGRVAHDLASAETQDG